MTGWTRFGLGVWLCLASALAWAEGGEGSVITAEDIAREHPASLSELLRSRAGVDDSSGSITMRGVRGIAFVLDGLPSSMTALTQLNLEDIERIDILRGAASASYGAEAMGGAIVVTRRRLAPAMQWGLTGSSSGSHSLRFGDERRLANWQLGLSIKDEHERGYRAVPQAPYANQITVQAESGYYQTAALRAGWTGNQAEVGAEVKHADNRTTFGRPNWWEHYVVDSAHTSLSAGSLMGSAGYERTDDLGLMDVGTGIDTAGLAPDRYILSVGDKLDATLSQTWRDVLGQPRLGVAWQRVRERVSIRPYAGDAETFVLDSSILNSALLAHLQGGERWRYELDARLDRHEYPGVFLYDQAGATAAPSAGLIKWAFNPKLSVVWQGAEAWSARASLGSGFVPPTPYQLYYSDTASAAWMLGNANLRPQRSHTADLGVEFHPAASWSLAATLFHTAWDDKIGVLITDYGTPLVRQFANIGSASAAGLELEAGLQWSPAWQTSLNYTYNRTRIEADQARPELIGNALADMPRHKLNAVLAYRSNPLNARLTVRHNSTAYIDEANTRIDAQGYAWRKPAWWVVDASLDYRLDNATLTLAVDNLFDRHYITGFFRQGNPRLLRAEMSWRM